MNQKILGILLVIWLLIWGFLFFSGFFDTPKSWGKWRFHSSEKPLPSYEEMKQEKEKQLAADKDIYNNALKTQDSSLCKDIKSIDEKRRCYDMISAAIALKERNKEKCDTLSNTGMIERCRDNVIFSLAEESWEKLSCALVSDENLRFQCESMIDTKNFSLRASSGSLDTAFCETLGPEVWDRCRAQIHHSQDKVSYKDALSAKTLDSCDTIDDSILRSQCRDAIIFEMAISQSDIDLCSSISNKPRSEYCQKSLSVRKDTMLYQTIVKEGDIIACDTLISEVLRYQCHDVILISEVRSNQDSSMCENLYNTGMIMSCQGLVRK